MKTFLLIVVTFIFNTSYSQLKIDTIHAGDLDLRYLPDGNQKYLVYLVRGEEKTNIWLWERNVSREDWHGRRAIIVRQQWTSSDTGYNSRKLISAVDDKTFYPLYHSSMNPKKGREAYNFSSTAVITADTVADAKNMGFSQALAAPTLNWELDLETFPLLPLKEGKTFVMNFYHPGGKTGPAWYSYSVIGSETIASVNGEKIDCYKLYIRYDNNQGGSTWWLSKKNHEVLKMEERFGNITRYKIKLAVSE
jgi:hypothetical protein